MDTSKEDYIKEEDADSNTAIRLAILEEAKKRQEEFQENQTTWRGRADSAIVNLQTAQAVLQANIKQMDDQRKEDTKAVLDKMDELKQSDKDMESNIRQVARETGANLTPTTTTIITVLCSLVVALLTILTVSSSDLRAKTGDVMVIALVIGLLGGVCASWIVNKITRNRK